MNKKGFKDKVDILVTKRISKIDVKISKKNYLAVLKMVIKNLQRLKAKLVNIDIVNMDPDHIKIYDRIYSTINKLFNNMLENSDVLVNMEFDDIKPIIANLFAVMVKLDKMYMYLHARYVDETCLKKDDQKKSSDIADLLDKL